MTFMLATALAAPWAEIDAVWEDGREVRLSEAVTVDGEPARLGMDLNEGDVVVVGPEAQLRIVYERGDQVVLYSDTEVTLGENTLLQELGTVFLDLEGAFKVLYGEVEAAVEGTRYEVAGDGATTTVRVSEGAVRVTAGGESVVVLAGEMTVVDGTPATPTETARWTPDGLGPPRTQVGVMGGGAWILGAPHAELRAYGRRRITPGWQAALSIGIESSGGRFHMPLAVGIERRFWRTAVGVEGMFFLGPETDCTGTRTVIKPGGAAVGRVVIARPGPFEFAIAGRAGYLDGFYSEGALEVGFAL
jgi:hypothetical protein